MPIFKIKHKNNYVDVFAFSQNEAEWKIKHHDSFGVNLLDFPLENFQYVTSWGEIFHNAKETKVKENMIEIEKKLEELNIILSLTYSKKIKIEDLFKCLYSGEMDFRKFRRDEILFTFEKDFEKKSQSILRNMRFLFTSFLKSFECFFENKIIFKDIYENSYHEELYTIPILKSWNQKSSQIIIGVY